MTCIVGLVDYKKEKIYMGADSAGVGGYNLSTRADKKIFINGEFLMGFTTSFRMGQLLRYSFEPPKIYPDEDIYKYMVTKFINSVRQCLKDGGYSKKKEEVEEGGTFLVGFKGGLFKIDIDYQVANNLKNYDACGCGQSFALGSLYSSENLDMESKDRVLLALKAAQEFSAGVREPFNILEI